MIVRGEGAYVWDQHGKRYLDGLAGLFTSQLGHGRTELAEAGAKQAGTLAYFPIWTYAHPRAIELADRLAGYAPGDLNRVFFTAGGSEAVESAWKLARQYFRRSANLTDQGRQPQHRLPRHDHGRSFDHRRPRSAHALRAAGARRDQGPQHQLLPGAALCRRRGGLRSVGGGRDRTGHRARGPGHRRRRLSRAGAERRAAASRLLPVTSSESARSATATASCSSPTR